MTKAMMMTMVALLPIACATDTRAGEDVGRTIAERRTHMIAMSNEMRTLGSQMASGTPDPAVVSGHAERLAELASELPSLFPPGSGPETGLATLARPEIWSRPEEFALHAEAMNAAAGALATSARASDLSEFRAQAMAIDAICVGCHRDFREQ